MPSGIYVGNKGRIPWNKGKKFSAEVIRKFKESKLKLYREKGNIIGFQKGNTCGGLRKTFIPSEETKIKIRKTLIRKGICPPHFSEEKSFCWKGDEVGYNALHSWVVKHLGKPCKCEHCGKDFTSRTKDIHWANKSGEYLRDLKDWLRLCRWCHKKYDLRKL